LNVKWQGHSVTHLLMGASKSSKGLRIDPCPIYLPRAWGIYWLQVSHLVESMGKDVLVVWNVMFMSVSSYLIKTHSSFSFEHMFVCVCVCVFKVLDLFFFFFFFPFLISQLLAWSEISVAWKEIDQVNKILIRSSIMMVMMLFHFYSDCWLTKIILVSNHTKKMSILFYAQDYWFP